MIRVFQITTRILCPQAPWILMECDWNSMFLKQRVVWRQWIGLQGDRVYLAGENMNRFIVKYEIDDSPREIYKKELNSTRKSIEPQTAFSRLSLLILITTQFFKCVSIDIIENEWCSKRHRDMCKLDIVILPQTVNFRRCQDIFLWYFHLIIVKLWRKYMVYNISKYHIHFKATRIKIQKSIINTDPCLRKYSFYGPFH